MQDPEPDGLGGWTITSHHLYDPESETFWGGDGSRRVVQPGLLTVNTVPQSVITPATAQPGPIAVGSDGTIYFGYASYVYRLSTQGVLTHIAGGGTTFSAPTPVAALSFQFERIDSLAMAPNGLLYEAGYSLVNVIDPVAQTVQTIAGQMVGNNPQYGCGNSPAEFDSPLPGLAVAPDGSIYVADSGCGQLRRLVPNGPWPAYSLTNVTAPSGIGYKAGSQALNVGLSGPSSVAVANDGTIYVGDSTGLNEGRLSRIDGKSGELTTVAGGFATSYNPPLSFDGRSAALLALNSSSPRLATAPDGTVYVVSADLSNVTKGSFQVWRIDPLGVAHLFAGGGVLSSSNPNEGDTGSAVNSSMNGPQGLAVAPDGSVLFSDYGCGTGCGAPRIRRIQSSFPGYQPGSAITLIPSLDGREIYGFSGTGRHLYTYDGTTGATLLTFHYDSSNRLSSIYDARSAGTTAFSYATTPTMGSCPAANAVNITAPLLQVTTLCLDGKAEAAYPAGPGRATSITNPNSETTTFVYGKGNGLMTSLTDPKGQVHSFTYDSAGQLIQDQDPTGASQLLNRQVPVTPLSPDGGAEPGLSWTTTVTSAIGAITTHQVQTMSNGSTVYADTSPSGAMRTYTHTSSDTRQVMAADGTQTVTTTAPDPQYGMLDPIMASVTTTTPSFESQTTQTKTVSPANALSPTTIAQTAAIGAPGSPQLTTTSTYTSNGSGQGGTAIITSTYVPTGQKRTIQQTVDGFDRTVSVLPVQWLDGSWTAAYVPGTTTPMASTSMAYLGALGQVSSFAVGSRAWGFAYNGSGYLASATDPVGNETQYHAYDLAGRLENVILPDTNQYSMSYDLDGNLTSVTVPPSTLLSSTHSFNYTPANLLQSYDPPQVSATDAGTDPALRTLNTSYDYDSAHNLVSTVVPEGASYDAATRQYDAYGRLSSLSDPLSGVTYTYTYSSRDQLAEIVTSDGVTVNNTYDGFLKTQTTWSSSLWNSSVAWTYDNLFRPSTLTVPGATTVAFSYVDPNGLYTGSTVGSSPFVVTRDPATGLVTKATLGLMTETWTYDQYGAPASFSVSCAGSVAPCNGTSKLYSYTIPSSGGRDANGRITAISQTSESQTDNWSFVYDSRGRLIQATQNGTSRPYGYDANGNVTNANGTAGTYDAQDRLVTLGSLSATYSNNGDLATLVSGGNTSAFVYDLESNLRSVTLPSSSGATAIKYTIDGANRRIHKNVTPTSGTAVQDSFMYDEQGRVVAEILGGSVRSVFVYGLMPNVPDYMIQNGTPYLIISDWHGSVRQVVNATTGVIEENIGYAEWGAPTITDLTCTNPPACLNFQPFGYAGGIYEPATGFVRFGARDYDPALKRWTQKDPIRFDGGQTNIYVYAGDDPINGTDPLGTNACDWVETMVCSGTTYQACSKVPGWWGPVCAAAVGASCFLVDQLVCHPVPPGPSPPPSPEPSPCDGGTSLPGGVPE